METFFGKSSANNSIQRIATLSVFLLSMQIGFYYGWTSPNTARLLSGKSPIPCTPSDISWLVSLTPMGALFGAILGSILVEYIGSRKTVFVTFLIMSISWLCVLSANSIEWLYAARFIGGLPSSLHCCCFSMYLSEISAPEMRGTLVSIAVIGIPFASVFSIIAETYLSQKLSTLIYLSAILIGMTLILYLKDTPYYLIKNSDTMNAKKSIMFYRGHTKVEEELKEIRLFVQRNSDNGIRDKISQLRLPTVKRAMIILIAVYALPDASGVLTLASYTEVILQSSGFDFVQPDQWVIYSSIISVIISFFTIKLLDKFGRRLALALSSIGTAVGLIGLGLHFYLLQSGTDVQKFQWLSVGSLLMYSIAFSIGYGPVPGTLLSEMFPQNIKSIAACLGSLTASSIGFMVVKAYQLVVDIVGEAYIFWIHAFLSILGVPCALFFLLETKGKTFQQIQDELLKK